MTRYRTVRVPHENVAATCGPCNVDGLQALLRPGDRIVSVYPIAYELVPNVGPISNHIPVVLEALLELRHPSWEKEGIGWVAGDTADEVESRRLAGIRFMSSM